jgi:inosose dehydratase
MTLNVANAPCSWGALEFNLDGKAAGFEQVLDEMAETGYAGTELGDWGFMPTEPADLSKELSRRSLALLGAFVPVDFSNAAAHGAGRAAALRVAKLLRAVGGDKTFVILADENGKQETRTKNAGRIKEGMGLPAAGWKTFGRGADDVARAVREEHGLRSVFHHHCAGYVETPSEVDALMNETDPSLLGLCLDMGHYRFGGGDPLAALKKYAGRIWHVHFKDCHPGVARESAAGGWDYFESVRRGVFCELGKGEVDFPAIVSELRARSFEGWIVVEQDVLPGMGSPKVCAQHNRDYLKSLGL